MVECVIQNLIDNAIKFTPEGGSIKLKLNSDDKNVEISVEDNGIGIEREELSHIFERMHQVEGETRKGKGARLRLGYCQKDN